jgi:hypothetical protein
MSFFLRLVFLSCVLYLGANISKAQTKPPLPTQSPAPKSVKISGGGCSHVQAFEYDRVTYQNTVDEASFAKISQWQPNRGEPAISFGKITRIARNYLRSLKLDDEPELLESVALVRFCGESWVYGVTFANAGPEKVVTISPGEQRVLGKYFYLFVRPDGSVIKPVERDRLKTIN